MDRGAALAFLRERGYDATDLAPLSGGLWSTTYAFRERGREYVVRFHERRDDLEKDRFAERWRSSRLRIPHMVEIGDLPDRGGYGIAERVTGTPLDDRDEAGMRVALPSLLDAIEAMRDADLAGTHGYGLWHGDGNGEFGSWREALLYVLPARDLRSDQRGELARSSVGTREFDLGLARMGELLPSCPEERHVVHNDTLNYNVLVDDRGLVLLDWGASIYGDFLYDAALLTFWWPWYATRWGRIDVRREVTSRFGRVPSFKERMRCYELNIGIAHIHFQATRRVADAAWTARRTLELANSPL